MNEADSSEDEEPGWNESCRSWRGDFWNFQDHYDQQDSYGNYEAPCIWYNGHPIYEQLDIELPPIYECAPLRAASKDRDVGDITQSILQAPPQYRVATGILGAPHESFLVFEPDQSTDT